MRLYVRAPRNNYFPILPAIDAGGDICGVCSFTGEDERTLILSDDSEFCSYDDTDDNESSSKFFENLSLPFE